MKNLHLIILGVMAISPIFGDIGMIIVLAIVSIISFFNQKESV